MLSPPPLISIIIVNFNGAKWIKNCLDSLLRQTYLNTEIIVVDNNSTDDSVRLIKDGYPLIKVLKNTDNFGFAKGNNIGVNASSGKYIFLLNNDTECTHNLIFDSIEYMERTGLHCLQPIILVKDNSGSRVIDSIGSYWTPYGYLYHQQYGRPFVVENLSVSKIFSAKGAAMFIRKDVIDQIGLFDDSFWCYYEETDLCHRMLLSGYEVMFVPILGVYHYRGGTSINFRHEHIYFHDCKNKIRSYIKNLSIANVIRVLFIFFISQFIFCIYQYLFKNKFLIRKFTSACHWNLVNLSNTLCLRSVVQSKRKLNDGEYLGLVSRNPHWSYYYKLGMNKLDEFVA